MHYIYAAISKSRGLVGNIWLIAQLQIEGLAYTSLILG